MPNTLSNIYENAGLILEAGAAELVDNVMFMKSCTQVDESEFKGKNGYSSGQQVNINKPPRFTPQTTFDITSSIQDVIEETVPLSLDISSTIGFDLSSAELAYKANLASVYKRFISPAITSIATDIDQRFLRKATQTTANLVGAAGSVEFGTDTILSARERLNKYLTPQDGERYFLCDSTASRAAVNARKGFPNSSTEIAKQYKMGYMGDADGFHWMENELLYQHTNGNDVTGVALNTVTVVNGTSSFSVSGLTTTTGTIKAGQVFTLASTFAVHPLTKVAYPFLQQFTVTADATADGSGNATISFSPAIYLSTSRQNVSATPATTAALVFVGVASTAYTQSLAFHKSAFRVASVPLVMPTKAEFAVQKTYKGITISIVRDFDVKTRKMITRLDFLGGLVADRPEFACRVTA